MDLRKINILRLLITTVYLAVVVDISFAQSVNVPGALPAEFSVSATNKVYFSQGNLQYCNNMYTADYNTWKFADNQYDNLGVNNVYSISYQNGRIDLFAYGTSGWNSGYTYYKPNEFTSSASCSSNNYLTEDLTGDYTNADWGVYNSIVNGGNTAGLWRTLTIEEWDYLINGRANASRLYYYSSVIAGGSTINGLMIFPDTSTICSKIADFGTLDSTFFTCTDWNSVQTLFNAVFLPITGTIDNQIYCDADSVTFSRYEGCYWSSSGYDCNTISIGALSKAYSFRFSPTNLNLKVGKGNILLNSSRSAHLKFAVRLVYDDHHIIFKNYNDSIICEARVNTGSIPTCNFIPTKPSSGRYEYTFKGWGNVVPAGKDTVYVAQYDSVEIPLCFTARYDSVIVRFDILNVTQQIQYSFDRLNWIDYATNTGVKLNANQSVYFRAEYSHSEAFGGMFDSYSSRFYFTGSDSSKVEASGNIMSLYGPDYPNQPLQAFAFAFMFDSCTILTTPPSLPATSLADACYENMFWNCTSLIESPYLPSTTLAGGCYLNMFMGCTSLVNVSELLADTLAGYCYGGMFMGCSSLVSAPSLPVMNLEEGCYYGMFRDCSSLISAPSLPATNLKKDCYSFMFRGCTSLSNAPELAATKLAERCYTGMFDSCTMLISTPYLYIDSVANYCCHEMFLDCNSIAQAPVVLSADSLSIRCYSNMFKGCSSLVSTPLLPATTLANYCYDGMFSGCSSLTTIPTLPATSLESNCYANMFYGCTSLVVNISGEGKRWVIPATTTVSSALSNMFGNTGGTMNGTPSVNTTYYIASDTMSNHLCFTAINGNANIRFDIKNATHLIEYSTDGANWNSYTPNTNISININQSVLFRAAFNQTIATAFGQQDTINSSRFYISSSGNGVVECSGNIMSLYGPDCPDVQLQPCAFEYLFYGCSLLTTVPKLPATHLASQCYKDLFKGCSSITTAPALPALNLADSCYCGMFSGCTSLAAPPALPATTMAVQCYRSMFDSCISLTTPPALPAITLADNCYRDMFINCPSLVKAPSLSADSMVNSCYRGMFAYCTSLTTPPSLNTTKLADNCYRDMFKGCSSLNTAPVLPATTLATECYSYMFEGCASLVFPPSLPATTLADGCYNDMFKYCSALIIAPELPATNLAIHCYERMFYYCTSLTSLPNLPATILPACCYYRMFWGCNSLVVNTSGSGKQWRLSINTTPPDDAVSNMFHGTSGTMNGTPATNTTYRIASVIYHNVILNVNDTSVGSVSGAGRYENGQEATLIATPKPHCYFVCWSNGDTALNIKYIVTSDSTLLATFAVDKHTITASGTNCQVEGAGEYNYGTPITLTATGTPNHHLVGWSDGDTANPRHIIVTEDQSYHAIYEIDRYTITVGSSNNGIVSGGGTYDYGSNVSLTATANNHYYFSRWSDGDTTNPRTITVTDDITCTAIFEGDLHSVSVYETNGGTASGSGTYHYGSLISLSATPDAHYHFVAWSDGDTANIRTVVVTGDTTYTAIFEIDKHIVSDSCINGSVIGVGEYDYGSKVTISALPDEHYSFVSWLDGDTSEIRSFVLTGDTVVAAIFDLTQYNISATCEHGVITGNGVYRYPDVVTLTVEPDKGYKFVEWSDGDVYNPRIFIAEEDLTIEAICEEVPEVDVDDVKDAIPLYFSDLKIYNPEGLNLSLYSADGRLLLMDTRDIDLTNLPCGVYIVRCNNISLKVVR